MKLKFKPNTTIFSPQIIKEKEIVYIDRPIEIIKEVHLAAEKEIVYIDKPIIIEKFIEKEVPGPTTIIEKFIEVPGPEKVIEKLVYIDVVGPEKITYIDKLVFKEKFKVPSYMVGILIIETVLLIYKLI